MAKIASSPVVPPWAGTPFTLDASALMPEPPTTALLSALQASAQSVPTVAAAPTSFIATSVPLPPPASITRPYASPLAVDATALPSFASFPASNVGMIGLSAPGFPSATSATATTTEGPTRTSTSRGKAGNTSDLGAPDHNIPGGPRRLSGWQIALIVIFGLASIPVSVIVIYLWRIGKRKKDFKHDEEWSSSFWKRHRRNKSNSSHKSNYTIKRSTWRGSRWFGTTAVPSQGQDHTTPSVAPWLTLKSQEVNRSAPIEEEQPKKYKKVKHRDGTELTPEEMVAYEAKKKERADKGKNKRPDRAWGSNISPPKSPHPGKKQKLVETEVGRAWGRPRRMEDEDDKIMVVPVPNSPTVTTPTALTRAAKESPTLMTPRERKLSLAAILAEEHNAVDPLNPAPAPNDVNAGGAGGRGLNASRPASGIASKPTTHKPARFEDVPLAAETTTINATGTNTGSSPPTPTTTRRLSQAWAALVGAPTSAPGTDSKRSSAPSKRNSKRDSRRQSRGNRRYSMDEAETETAAAVAASAAEEAEAAHTKALMDAQVIAAEDEAFGASTGNRRSREVKEKTAAASAASAAAEAAEAARLAHAERLKTPEEEGYNSREAAAETTPGVLGAPLAMVGGAGRRMSAVLSNVGGRLMSIGSAAGSGGEDEESLAERGQGRRSRPASGVQPAIAEASESKEQVTPATAAATTEEQAAWQSESPSKDTETAAAASDFFSPFPAQDANPKSATTSTTITPVSSPPPPASALDTSTRPLSFFKSQDQRPLTGLTSAPALPPMPSFKPAGMATTYEGAKQGSVLGRSGSLAVRPSSPEADVKGQGKEKNKRKSQQPRGKKDWDGQEAGYG